MFDIIIVGAGFTGSVVARCLAEKNKKVRIVERRSHIAGNMFDERDPNGILVQKYGPHIFHTTSQRVFSYISQYGKWLPFYLKCMVYMEGKFTPSPFNFQTIDDYYPSQQATEIKARLQSVYPNRKQAPIVELLQCEDPVVRGFADFLFEKDYAPYTAKQWGVSPQEIDISVLQRVPVLLSYEDGYFSDPYQVMPKDGYTAFFRDLLNHPNISVSLNIDAHRSLTVDLAGERILWEGEPKPVVYTGPLDELFACQYGYLPYRSLHFEYKTEPCDSFQSAPVVAYPLEKHFTRITEYKKLPEQPIPDVTTYAVEFPLPYNPEQGAEPYYPVFTSANQQRYEMYQNLANKMKNLYIGGRLADYKYYNMDQAVLRALELFDTIDS